MSDMELILLLCLLSLWAGCTSAQENGPGPGVVNVPEGDDALLDCAQASGQSVDEFDWRKDNGDEEKKEVFMYTKGSYFGNGLQGQNEQFKGRVEFFQHKLESGNASIVIKNSRLEDNGTYTCGLGLDMYKRKEIHIRLNVGAARLPHIHTIHDKITWRVLECEAQGVPEPEVEWRNSDGKVLAKHNIQSQDIHSQVKLQVKLTRSDTYTCVVTQRDIYHQISKSMTVSIPDVAVSEGDEALLPCSLEFKDIDENVKFSWKKDDKEVFFYDKGQVKEDKQFVGRLMHFQHELKSGNASIKIHTTQTSDSGSYTCHFSNIEKSRAILFVVGTENKHEHSTGKVITLSVVITIVIIILVVGLIVWCLSAKGYQVLRKGTGQNPEDV